MKKPPIQVDAETLNALSGNLAIIQSLLSGLDASSPPGVDSVGHPELAAKIKKFYKSWKYNRADMEKVIGVMNGAIQDFNTQLIEFDEGYATVISRARASMMPVWEPK